MVDELEILSATPAPDGATLTWTKREPIGLDPFYNAILGPLMLDVRVACECFWEWSIEDDEEGELARGTTCVDVDPDEWDYQDVAEAQRRCEVVARALLSLFDPGEAVPA